MPSAGLPEHARRKLTAKLRARLDGAPPFGESHTLPLSEKNANWYFAELNAAISELWSAIDDRPDSFSFHECARWISRLEELHAAFTSALALLSPFRAFDHAAASRTWGAVKDRLMDAFNAFEASEASRPTTLKAIPMLAIGVTTPQENLIAETFAIDPGVRTEGKFGLFQPGVIFREYLYDGDSLRRIIEPHFASLGLRHTSDGFACVMLLGSIVSTEDYVLASAAARSLLNHLRHSENPKTTAQVTTHLADHAPALRQTRVRISRLLLSDHSTEEEVNMALAELYKRVVEGPFKQYLWAHWSLARGSWSPPPMLGTLREQVSASGYWVSGLAERCILPQMRNAEAHEAIAWDGHENAFWIAGELVPLDNVRVANSSARSFSSGSEGAFLWYWSTLHERGEGPAGRHAHALDGWERCVATFGANGVEIVDADLNRPDVAIQVSALERWQINPSLVALTNAQISLPKVTEFSVIEKESGRKYYTVSATSLQRCRPLRDWASRRFALMPFSVFLPANWDARRRRETPLLAVRSVAWIAVDDVLDAIYTAEQHWGDASRVLLTARIHLVAAAVEEVLEMADPRDCHRLSLVARALAGLQEQVAAPPSRDREWFASLDSVKRLEHYWNSWGPVPRLPGFLVDEDGPPDPIGPAQRLFWY